MWLRELGRAAERSPEGHARHVVGVLMDITAEKQRIEAAAHQTALLRDLSAALFRVEENERRELATLLHDVLGQQLVAARLQLGALKPSDGDAETVREVVALLDDAHQAVRSVTFQLRPPILQDLGLVAGLRWLARETSAQFKLPIAVIAEDTLPRLAGDPEYLLFRCVRELLLNVVKHAEATAARVEVGGDEDDILVIRVSDDGKGFDPPRLTADRQTSRSFGLLSVRERIMGLGGHVRIDSTPARAPASSCTSRSPRVERQPRRAAHPARRERTVTSNRVALHIPLSESGPSLVSRCISRSPTVIPSHDPPTARRAAIPPVTAPAARQSRLRSGASPCSSA
ncbi:sensor histidine kinase [Nannocystis pusilla]|uniref:sensor histidine kinase n=1 Tax=Nannocystis pusilla TaxID=889268 RepID=UPI003B7B1A00